MSVSTSNDAVLSCTANSEYLIASLLLRTSPIQQLGGEIKADFQAGP
jgi:hypothetical protein